MEPHIVRIFISSPGDVAHERTIARNVVDRLRGEYAGRLELQPILWEDLPLLASDSFQAEIERLASPAGADIAIFILWTRLGTPLGRRFLRPDGTPYASGTEYEFDVALQAYRQFGKPAILVYRKSVPPDNTKDFQTDRRRYVEQLERLEEFTQERFRDPDDGTFISSYHRFEQAPTFESKLEGHLRQQLDMMIPLELGGTPCRPIWSGSPFRGLNYFDFEHKQIFFGRSRASSEVVRCLQTQATAGRAFVLLVGGSGSGKSSLARAGVLPFLATPGAVEGVGLWRRAALRPGEAAPGGLCRALALALAAEGALPELRVSAKRLDALALALHEMHENPTAALMPIEDALARAAEKAGHGGEARLFLIIDQLEELFTHADAPAGRERERFVAALAALAGSGLVWVLATLRSDFYKEAQQLRGLLALRGEGGQVDLLAPEADELAQIISRPASLAGLHFEEDPSTHQTLDQRILADAARHPEGLPLLEYALDELYKLRTADGWLTFDAYKQLGGVEGALARRAKDIFLSLPPEARAAAVAVAFPALVRVSVEAGAATRVYAAQEAFDGSLAARAFIERFTAERLLRAEHQEGRGAVISFAHEALLGRWKHLAEWIQENREWLRVRDRVVDWMRVWHEKDHLPEFLIPECNLLVEAEELLAKQKNHLAPEIRDYIQLSSSHVRLRQECTRRAARRVILSISGLLLLAVIFGVGIFIQYRKAESEKQKVKNALSRSDFLQADALFNVARTTPARTNDALAYLIHALVLDPDNKPALLRLYSALTQRNWSLRVGKPMKHKSDVLSAQFSPDGRYVVTVSDDCTAWVWGVPSGEPVGKPLRHEKGVNSLQFSLDGRYMVTTSDDKTARVWAMPSGKPLSEPLKHEHFVKNAQFSPDGRYVVTASDDKTARVWEVSNGRLVGKPLSHEQRINSARFSPDGRMVVTASDDKIARLWEVPSGNPVGGSLKHEGIVNSAQFSPDGRYVVTASTDNAARVWEVPSGRLVGEPLRHMGRINSVQFRPDGRYVVTASDDKTARVWELPSGKPAGDPLKHENGVRSAQFSPDGRYVVTASDDKTAQVWAMPSGKPVSEPLNHENGVRSAQFSPDGRYVVTASGDRTAQVWSVTSDKPVGEPLRYAGGVNSVQFSPDGRYVVTASSGRTARMWEVSSGRAVGEPLKAEGVVTSAQFSPDGRYVVTSSFDSTARIWEVPSGRAVGEPLKHKGCVVNAQFSLDGHYMVTASTDKTAQVWEVPSGKPVGKPLRHEEAVESAQFSPDGHCVVTASTDKTARIWDVQSGKPMSEPLRHEREVLSAQFSPNGRYVVTASADKTARVWDVQSDKPVGKPLRHEDYVMHAQFSPDGRYVATASFDHTARLWEVPSGNLAGESLKHEGGVNNAQFSSDGRYVVTASDDKTARVWEVPSGKPVSEPLKHENGVWSAQFSPDGCYVVTSSVYKTAQVWTVNPLLNQQTKLLFLRAASAIVGWKIGVNGAMEPISGDIKASLKKELAAQPDGDPHLQVTKRLLLGQPAPPSDPVAAK